MNSKFERNLAILFCLTNETTGTGGMQLIWTAVHTKIKTSTYSVCNGKSITVLKPTRWLFCPSLFPPIFKKLLASDGLSLFQNSNNSYEHFGHAHGQVLRLTLLQPTQGEALQSATNAS